MWGVDLLEAVSWLYYCVDTECVISQTVGVPTVEPEYFGDSFTELSMDLVMFVLCT